MRPSGKVPSNRDSAKVDEDAAFADSRPGMLGKAGAVDCVSACAAIAAVFRIFGVSYLISYFFFISPGFASPSPIS
jgi:hypothetical protein